MDQNQYRLSERLTSVRVPQRISKQETIRSLLIILIIGTAMGSAAKFADHVAVLGEVFTMLGAWIFSASLIAAKAPNAGHAALRVFVFFLGMLIGYYTTTVLIFGFTPVAVMLIWSMIALASPLCGWIVWYGAGIGWFAAFCASLPIALMLSEGYSFVYTFRAARGIDLLLACVLFFVLSNRPKQRVKSILASALLFVLFLGTNLLSLLFGGL